VSVAELTICVNADNSRGWQSFIAEFIEECRGAATLIYAIVAFLPTVAEFAQIQAL
jgi:hypothetical protein